MCKEHLGGKARQGKARYTWGQNSDSLVCEDVLVSLV